MNAENSEPRLTGDLVKEPGPSIESISTAEYIVRPIAKMGRGWGVVLGVGVLLYTAMAGLDTIGRIHVWGIGYLMFFVGIPAILLCVIGAFVFSLERQQTEILKAVGRPTALAKLCTGTLFLTAPVIIAAVVHPYFGPSPEELLATFYFGLPIPVICLAAIAAWLGPLYLLHRHRTGARAEPAA